VKSWFLTLPLCLCSCTTCLPVALGSSLRPALSPHEGCFDFSQNPSGSTNGAQPPAYHDSATSLRALSCTMVSWIANQRNLCRKIFVCVLICICRCVCVCVWRACVYISIMHLKTYLGTHRVISSYPWLYPRCCLKTLTYKK